MNTHRPLVLLSKQLVDEDEKEYVIVTHTLLRSIAFFITAILSLKSNTFTNI